jgi:hypothetical protein
MLIFFHKFTKIDFIFNLSKFCRCSLMDKAIAFRSERLGVRVPPAVPFFIFFIVLIKERKVNISKKRKNVNIFS